VVIITGASGFIGAHLVKALEPFCQSISLRESGWSETLKKQRPSAIVHLAGSAHSQGSAKVIRDVNIKLTTMLCKKVIQKRVPRFLFVSSIGAVAEKSREALTAATECRPGSPYGYSKFEAEKILKNLTSFASTSYTIIRPPLVYGARNPGNMAKLLKIVDSGIPLPVSALDSNRRSFVGISNLIDLILLCLEHPAAANQTFHVSDDDDISTAEMLRRMGKALGKPVRNLPIPQTVLKTGLRLIGKGEWVDKLCGDLRVDIEETKQLLGWKPKVTMEEELARTAHWWKTRKK